MQKWARYILQISIGVFIANPIYAEWHEHDYDVALFSFGAAGATKSNVQALNLFLREQGGGQVTERSVNVSAGSLLFVQRLFLGSELGVSVSGNEGSGSTRSTLAHGVLSFSAGVDFLPPEGQWRLYPYFSVSGALTRLHMSSNHLLFGEALTRGDPQHLTAWRGRVLMGGGVGLMRVFAPGKNMYAVGVRAGFTSDQSIGSAWYSNGSRLSGGPDLLLSGTYVQVTLGFGQNPRFVATRYPGVGDE